MSASIVKIGLVEYLERLGLHICAKKNNQGGFEIK